jgi:HEPN domain-containing protein
MNLPSLADLAYQLTDQGEHEFGGHCLAIDRSSPDQWFTVLDQYHRVFEQEVEAAQSDVDGWARTRVVVFLAHHCCELALKTALDFANQPTTRGHRLRPLYQSLATVPGAVYGGAAEVAWIDGFLNEIEQLTTNGEDARFPDAANDPSDILCCVNIPRLKDAVAAFLALVVPDRGTSEAKR